MAPGTGAEQLAVLATGFGAGVLTTTVGVASLLSFPVLVALGLPPVVANASNTVGLLPGALSGAFGYRAELREVPATTARVLLACALGAVVGAVLLLALPSAVFEAIAPWLILCACVLVGVQPPVSAWVRRRRTGPEAHLPRLAMSPATTFLALLTGVYGGYFGAGAGVVMVAVLGLGLDLQLRVVNALKTGALLAANLVATVIFVAVADLDWPVIGLLAAGSVVGGYAGAHIGRRLPPAAFRLLVVATGVVAAVTMLG